MVSQVPAGRVLLIDAVEMTGFARLFQRERFG